MATRTQKTSPIPTSRSRGRAKSTATSTAVHVIGDFRNRILTGELHPGQRLPTWEMLGKHYNVGRPTLMRALARLKQDGLVVADSTRGTFVAERPPHLFRYAMVFPEGPGQSGWNRFWAGLDWNAAFLQRSTPKEIPCFYWTEPHPDNESFVRLLRESQAGRLAGMIVVGGGPMTEPATIEKIGLPAVALQAELPNSTGLPIIDVQNDSFIEEALRGLQSQGRKRPAILTNVYNSMQRIMGRLAEFGLSANPSWLQGVSTHHPWWAGQVVKLLLDPSQHERPDSLIITDDNLADAAVAALVEMGVRVPQDLAIVTHSNFTHPVAPVVPMLRLGFDTRKMLLMALDAIDSLRANRPVPMLQLVKAEPVRDAQSVTIPA